MQRHPRPVGRVRRVDRDPGGQTLRHPFGIDPRRESARRAGGLCAAKAGLTDTQTAADAITTVLNAYGLAAERAGDVSDLLFSIVKRGKTTFGLLAPNIGKVATVASAAGLSLEELGATIATLTRNGAKTEQAMTAVAAIIATFLKPSTEGAEAARQLGFELNVASLAGEGLRGVLERMASLPADALAEIFPNVEALRGILPALRSMEVFFRGHRGHDRTRRRNGQGLREDDRDARALAAPA